MRRFVSILLAATLLAGAFGGLLAAAPRVATSEPATEPPSTAAYGPHWMLPNPDLYPTIPFTQSASWTGTPPSGTRAGGPNTRGIQPVLVLLVYFTDVPPQAGSEAAIRTLVADATPGAHSLANYYREVSYGLFGINATVSTWYSSGHSLSYYGADSSSTSYDDLNGPIYRLVIDAVRAAAADGSRPWRFSDFDKNNDNVVDHIIVVHAGGAQEATGRSNDIWSHRWSVIDADAATPGDQALTADGKQVYGYSMDGEASPVGVFAHELGHDLGLPDLYDTDGSSDGIGVWDVMSTGSWNGSPRGTSPAEFSAWSKIKLGWIAPVVVTSALLGQAIGQVETNATAFKLPIRSAAAGDEYFLVENRERTGFDASLPGGGLLIWHVDDSLSGNQNDAHRLVDLEEADGNNKPTQSTDLWSNSVDGWGPDTTPNSNSYLNQRTGWKVRNIGAIGPTMTADISREVDDDLVVISIQRPCCVPVGSRTTIGVTVGNRGARAQQNIVVNLTVYRGSVTPANAVCCGNQTISSLVQGQAQNLSWDVTAGGPGKYILDAFVPLALDEIPENNHMFSHFTAGTYYFLDDVEAGNRGWTKNGGANDPARWEIKQDGNESESHSPTHAWRFGPEVGLCLPLCPDFHTLTSTAVNVPGGLTYAYLWQRFDLRGRGIDNNTNAVESDTAYVNVSINGGPWRSLDNYSSYQPDWHAAFWNLTSLISGPSTVVLQLSASSRVVLGLGGWWVDDIAISDTPLTGGLVARAVTPTETVEPGGVAIFRFKVANVGDFDDTVGFALQPPTGWIAAIGQNQTRMSPYDQFLATLRPDADATLLLGFQVAVDAARGTRYTIPVTVTSRTNTSIATTFDAIVIINDPFGLAGLERYVFLFLIVFAVIIVVAVVIDAVKKQRGTYRRW